MKTAIRTVVLGAALLAVPAAPAQEADGGSGAPAAAAKTSRVKALEKDIQKAFQRIIPAYIVVSGGSGVVISPDGWALTNHHVVAGRQIGDRWWVRRPGNEAVVAKLVGWDPRGDIALLKLESSEPLPFAPLGDSDAVKVGDIALALGNPYGFAWNGDPTATLGIVSAVKSYQDAYSDAIQTDAPINPGNSGGPLLNLDGEVIGINGRVAVRFGNRMNTGIGYAISSNQIKRFLPGLKVGGTVAHGRVTGLYIRDHEGMGALVTRIDDQGTAKKAGFQQGDVIVRVGGRSVETATDVYSETGAYVGGDLLDIEVLRNGERIALKAELQAYAVQNEVPTSGAWLGVRIGGMPEDSEVEGAMILSVEPNSAASEAGLQANDMVTAIDGTSIRSDQELIQIIRSKSPGDEIEIDIVREGTTMSLKAKLKDWKDRRS